MEEAGSPFAPATPLLESLTGDELWEEGAGAHPVEATWPLGEDSVRVESINITSLRTAEAWLIVRRTVMFVQEHAIPLAQQVGWIKRAAAKGYSLILTPTDPEAAQPRGGGGGRSFGTANAPAN